MTFYKEITQTIHITGGMVRVMGTYMVQREQGKDSFDGPGRPEEMPEVGFWGGERDGPATEPLGRHARWGARRSVSHEPTDRAMLHAVPLPGAGGVRHNDIDGQRVPVAALGGRRRRLPDGPAHGGQRAAARGRGGGGVVRVGGETIPNDFPINRRRFPA